MKQMNLKFLEIALERLMFMSRWIMAPFYFGLIICLIFLFITFFNELLQFFLGGMKFEETQMILFSLQTILLI